jgi:hypothetical protein
VYLILKVAASSVFYFFVLTQKSNKKGQGFGKMTKNFEISLNPANSPLVSFILEILLAQIPTEYCWDRLFTAYFKIFLTSFFRGRGYLPNKNILPDSIFYAPDSALFLLPLPCQRLPLQYPAFRREFLLFI